MVRVFGRDFFFFVGGGGEGGGGELPLDLVGLAVSKV